jgi:predicted acyl esterase
MVYERCLPGQGEPEPERWRLPSDVLLALRQHSADGPYYWERSARTKFDRITIPVFHIVCASQFIHYRGHLLAYSAINTPKKLLVGTGSPWAFFHSRALSQQIGQWLDFWLKGTDSGIMNQPTVTMYVSGADEWRYEDDYPPARMKYAKLYLRCGDKGPASEPPFGSLRETHPEDEAPDSYQYPESQRVVEANLPVLGYSTPPLSEDMELIGPASLVLYAASTVEDASWMVKIDDEAPDGSCTVVSKGWLRASHREVDEARSTPGQPFHIHTNPAPIEPDKVYRYEIGIWPIFRTFKKGHRLRLRIASSDSRTWDANNFHTPVELPATNTVYHDSQYPSHLLLPSAPAAGAAREKPDIDYKPSPPIIGARGSWGK